MLTSRKVRVVAPYPIKHEFNVTLKFNGFTLQALMAARFPFKPESEWKRLILEGKVGVNENACSPGQVIRTGDRVFHFNPKVIEPSVPDEIGIIEETDEYLAVFKPAPMPMHPGGRYNKNSLSWILEERGYKNLKIIHRLDAVTSGIVLLGKTTEFANKAMQCFTDKKVEKTYYAVVSGVPKTDNVQISESIRRKNGFVFECGENLPGAKTALTNFEVHKKGHTNAIIKCRPVTGRTHQIRLHLERWGHPIIDDPVYGRNGDKSSKKLQNTGISLLSSQLRIDEMGIDLNLELPQSWYHLI